ncbi:uncharacterized protein G2W53_018052 [Senna tora]|uniref:Uncharacterized protein n=1 Tax=Senna tora TaxID=362788 RepID=A0A834TQL4_9FABA|nr:uncharacterized protein G2W53_018052 [Senna tora]
MGMEVERWFRFVGGELVGLVGEGGWGLGAMAGREKIEEKGVGFGEGFEGVVRSRFGGGGGSVLREGRF